MLKSSFKYVSYRSNILKAYLMNHSTSSQHVITLDNINPGVKKMEYAVRGPIVARAQDINNELKMGKKLPFNEVIFCNVGDCHATGQVPITFLRQVLALLCYPHLFSDSNMPEDVKYRARRILDDCSGSVGSYSDSAGVKIIRKDIASFIRERDQIDCDYEHVFLSTGASESVKAVLQIMSGNEGTNRAGVLTPTPQYPLYSASIVEYNLHQIPYYLNENKNWSLCMDELNRALESAEGKCQPRAIVVINPGNPTGQVLSREDIVSVIQFAKKNKLVILADEVYQHNVYATNSQFYSFKRVLYDMGEGFADQVELASFMSASKGYMGECGFRGGYCELVNWHPGVQAVLFKQLSAKLCCSVIGQALMGVIANPPRPGEPSYDLFMAEKGQVLSDLKFKAKLVTETFNSMPGIKCNEVQGAMYAFPQLDLPTKFILEAEKKGIAPDVHYCFKLLEEKGVCVVPGSGFGQQPGTHHFRTTILPPVEKLKKVMVLFKEFHTDLLKAYQ